MWARLAQAVLLALGLCCFGCGRGNREAGAVGMGADRGAGESGLPRVERTTSGTSGVPQGASVSNAVPAGADGAPAAVAAGEVEPQTLAQGQALLARLEEDARFSDALHLCRSLSRRFAGDPASGGLRETASRLRDARRVALELPFAVGNLGSESLTTASVAKRKLVESGPTGRIVMRKSLRELPHGRAVNELARLLVEVRDRASLSLVLQRFIEKPDSGLGPILVTGIQAMGDALGTGDQLELVRAAALLGPAQPESQASTSMSAVIDALVEHEPRLKRRELEDGVPEGDLELALGRIAVRALRKGAVAQAAAVCDVALACDRVEAGEGNGPASALLALLELGVTPEAVLGVCRDQFFRAVGAEELGVVRDLLRVVDALESRLTRENDQLSLKALELDAAFLLEDYARSLRVLEETRDQYDESWYSMAVTKVRGHLAWKEGRHADAVSAFRQVMGFVSETKRKERDPSTGVQHTTGMLMASSARRIGEILASAGDAAGAEAACRESRELFAGALKESKPGSRQQAVIQSEVDALDALLKKLAAE